jgi:fermentation-respiration switch protein FrsA (DUF1100 family)
VFLLIVYAGVVAVFWFFERRMVFLPTAAQESWLKPVDERTRDVSFPAGDGETIHAWWLPPAAPQHGAVLLAHGNGGNLSHRGKAAAELRAALGAGVLMFDYPGYGNSTGRPSEAGCYAAGEAAYQWLTGVQQIPANRIILCGESLGGGTAVELATRHEHRALVLVFSFTDLPSAAKYHFPFLPTRTLMSTRFDNLSKIGRCHRPVFLIHGTDDRVVPFDHAERLLAAANEPKQLLRVEGGGHDLSILGPALGELANFLNRHAP